MELTTSLVMCVVGSLIIVRWLGQLLFDYVRYSYPPGPRQLPIWGSYGDLKNGKLHMSFLDHKKKYGDLSHVTLFGSDVVMLNSIEVMREAMLNAEYKNIFSGRMTTLILKYVAPDDLIFNPYDAKWARLRKLVHNTITPYASDIKRIEDTITSEIQCFKEELKLRVKNPFNIHEYIVKAVGNIMYILIIGERFDYNHQIHECSWPIFGNSENLGTLNALILTLFPAFRHFSWGPGKAFHDFKRGIHRVFAFLYKDVDNEDVTSEKKGILYEMLRQQRTTKWLTDGNIHDVVFDLLLAGMMTTSTTLYILILILIHKQAFQKRLQNEIDEVVGRKRAPNLGDLPYMPYTRAVILETLRFSSFLGPGPAHSTLEDVTFRGFHLKKDTIVMSNIWLMNHDEAVWEDPWLFNPDRFLDENGLLVPPEHPNRRNLVAFGLGNRRCIGDVFARNRLFLFVTHLYQKFDIYHDHMETVPSMNPRDFAAEAFIAPRQYELQLAVRESEDTTADNN